MYQLFIYPLRYNYYCRRLLSGYLYKIEFIIPVYDECNNPKPMLDSNTTYSFQPKIDDMRKIE